MKIMVGTSLTNGSDSFGSTRSQAVLYVDWIPRRVILPPSNCGSPPKRPRGRSSQCMTAAVPKVPRFKRRNIHSNVHLENP
ncbi:unnamed protein product [Caenorhabditis auriculariae]|uniref:Uncharacterized protein n=1 Tax=Caenorhabditis auriculariae TaxID=2777116 RepID=A0A8S1HSZ4_9PELO|nr:unnamed protein product [Caenorhabditis auriculariae]